MRNRDVTSHARQRFPECDGGGLDIIQKPQLTQIERLGEMETEKRIADAGWGRPRLVRTWCSWQRS